MGLNDLWMREIFTIYGSIVLGFIVIYYIIHWNWSKLTSIIYRAHLVGFEAECAYLAAPFKKRLFEPLNFACSNDEILRSDNCIRIVEIGVKTGENFQFYPDGTHVIGVDWNHRLQEYLTKSHRAWQFSHVIIEKIIIGDGSCLKGIPTGCVDAVITVRSLCSTSAVAVTLQEIRRVLAPGGKYFFMEHVPDEEGTFTYWLQNFLTITKIWPSFFGDCRLDSDPTKDIEAAKFSDVTWESITLRGYISHPYRLNLSCHHVMGIATK